MAEGSEYVDESLDFTSPKFDPLKALYSKNVRLPVPNAPVLDNIHKYRSSLNPREKKKSAKVCYYNTVWRLRTGRDFTHYKLDRGVGDDFHGVSAVQCHTMKRYRHSELRRVREICIESDNLPHNPKRSVVACTST
jgi:hypothetical protein